MNNTLVGCSVFIVLISTTLLAMPTFEDNKKSVLTLVEQRIDILNTYRGCIESSLNTEALRECKRAEKKAIKGMREESRERKKMAKQDEIDTLEKQ